MPHVVAVVAFDGISPFHLAVPSAVFTARYGGGPRRPYEVVVCATTPGAVRTDELLRCGWRQSDVDRSGVTRHDMPNVSVG